MKTIFTLASILCFSASVFSQSFSSLANTAATQSGTGNRAWTNTIPSSTSASLNNGNPNSENLYFKGFNFSALPTNINITGLQVTVNRSASVASSVNDLQIQLLKANVLTGSNKASGISYPTIAADQVYGGNTDVWGSTWSRTDITDANFGISVSAHRSANVVTPTINSVSITVYYTTVAPIILTRFNLELTSSNAVNISWTTANEDRVKTIFIERSADGRNFSTLFTLTPKGTKNINTDYSVTDKAPLEGINYYRLREADVDGRSAFFDIKFIMVKNAAQKFQAVYTGGSLKVNISNRPGDYILSLFDMNGVLLGQEKIRLSSGSSITNLALHGDHSGILLLNLRGEGFNETQRVFIHQ